MSKGKSMNSGIEFAELTTHIKAASGDLLNTWSLDWTVSEDQSLRLALSHSLSDGLDIEFSDALQGTAIKRSILEKFIASIHGSAEVAYCARAPTTRFGDFIVDLRSFGACQNLTDVAWVSLVSMLADHGLLEQDVATWLRSDLVRKPGEPSA